MIDEAQRWRHDQFRDSYAYRYDCGHEFHVAGVLMQRGGQLAPPICPTCHGQAAIDQMEAANWRKNPKWQGYGQSFISTGTTPSYDFANHPLKVNAPSGHLAWLELSLNKVSGRAWH